MKKKIIEIFSKKGIFLDENELENLAEAMQETLEALADDLEVKEPYATISIARYREVAGDLVTEILEAD
jgi:hypothetical protein